MYEEFYGLRERPFDLTPNPRFLFMTAGHGEALSTIQYGISGRRGIALLVGPAGTGKTTLVHAALERQSQHGDAKAVFLTNPTLSREEFFQFLAMELGLTANAAKSKTHFLRELKTLLVKRQAGGSLTALIVDEAQSMPDQLLEEVRLLANMETTTEKLLPVVLVGQLELSDRLNGPTLRPLKQRVALRSALQPLSESETAAYISQRIRIAGGDVRTVFDRDAIAAIAHASAGIPRTISVICDNALVCGFAVDEKPIGPGIIGEVCGDFDLPLHTPRRPAPRAEAPRPMPAAPSQPAVVPVAPAIRVAAGARGRGVLDVVASESSPMAIMVVPSHKVLTLPTAAAADLREPAEDKGHTDVDEPEGKKAGYGRRALRSVMSRMTPR